MKLQLKKRQIEVKVNYKNIKHFYYRISLNSIEVSCSRRYSKKEILNLLKENINKIQKAHDKLAALNSNAEALDEIFLFGKKLKLKTNIDPNRAAQSFKIEKNRILLELNSPLTQEFKELIKDAVYKSSAPSALLPRVEYYSEKMGLYPSRVTFRKAKTRWGSCSNRNSISLNTALCALPQELSDYVIIHELAHIKHKNHSKEFWNLVSKYCPNYKILRQELKNFSLIL